MNEAAFEVWIKGIFDHAEGAEAWYYDYKAQPPEPAPGTGVEFLRRLFTECGTLLAGYSNRQLKDGLWYLLDSSNSNAVWSLIDPDVPLAERVKTVEAIYRLCEDCFFKRCDSALSHLSEARENPLNSICYMLWDVAPLSHAGGQAEKSGIVAPCFEVMRKTLLLPNDACRESALHGLGHSKYDYPAEVATIITPFLAQKGLRPELRRYAEAALEGMVQ